MANFDAQGRELFLCYQCHKKLIEERFEKDRHGHRRKGCRECKAKREARKCEHGRQRNLCIDCGGCGICEHLRQRQQCKPCGGSSICEHGRQRAQCKECGGSAVCIHGRQRSLCKECGGSSICEHGRQRNKCKDCGGSSICEHGRVRHTCKDCGGASICTHARRRSKCKDCGGSSICEHGRQRTRCKECEGSGICEHGRERFRCKDCDPAGHLRSVVSTRIRDALNSNKDRGTLEYLCCTIEEFRHHIESTFQPGMTWDNHGKATVDGLRAWQIDHVVPIKYPGAAGGPPTIEEVGARLHWRNTQAMWAEDNIAKGNRFVGRKDEVAQPALCAEPEKVWLTDEDLADVLAEFGC